MKISLKNTVLTASLALSFSASFSSHATDEVSAQAVTRQVSRSIQDVVSGAQFDDSTGQHGFFMLPDACTNIPGYQGSAPSGYEVVGTTCTAPCVAPANSSTMRVESCGAGYTGSKSILTTTSFTCPSTYGAPVPSYADTVVATSCSTNFPWEDFYNGRHIAILGKIPRTLNGRLNSSGNLFGFNYIPTYVSSGVTYQSSFNADSFDKTKALLESSGYKMIAMRRLSGGTYEYNYYWSFIAQKDGAVYLGAVTSGTSRMSRCKWRAVEQCGGDASRYTYDIPFPVQGHLTYTGTTISTLYGIHDHNSGIGGYFTQSQFMVPTFLGRIASVSEFQTSAAWRWGNIGPFNVYLSQPYSMSQIQCDTPRITTILNNGTRVNQPMFFSKYCSVGAPFVNINNTKQSSYIPMFPEWSIPYNE